MVNSSRRSVFPRESTRPNSPWPTRSGARSPAWWFVDRLSGEIDLLSIFFGPLTLRNIEITGARVLFEADSEHRFNWNLGDGKPSADRQSG